MRIAHLCNRMANLADGIINVVVDLATWQAAAGHDVLVVSAGGDYEPLLHANGVRTVRVDFARRTPLDPFRAFAALRQELRAFAPDIVHAHTMTPAVLAPLAAPRSAYRVATVHNEFQRGSRLMGLANAVVCVSHGVEQKMTQHPLCRGKTHVIHNGVVGTPRRTGAVPPATLAHPAVLALGSVSRRKGSDTLLAAFGEIAETHASAHLYFVGNLDDPSLITPFADRPWFQRVHFEGAHRDPTGYLASADVLAIASRQDPHPLALLEGRQAGIAIVGTRVDGIPEALDEGRAGMLSEPDDPHALAANLRTLLDSDSTRAAYAVAAAEGMQAYTVDRMAREYDALYRTRPGKKGRR